MLPWGVHKERSPQLTSLNMDMDIRPGEFVMRTLFADFTLQAEKKIETVLSEHVSNIGKYNVKGIVIQGVFFKTQPIL
jgi:hypothetical protein